MKKQKDGNIAKWISMHELAGTVSMLIVSLLLVIFISRTGGSTMSSAGGR